MSFKHILTREELQVILDDKKNNWKYEDGFYTISFKFSDQIIKYKYKRYYQYYIYPIWVKVERNCHKINNN